MTEESIFGQRGVLRIPHMPEIDGQPGRVRFELPTGKLEFELDRVPDMHMTGRVYVVEREDVEWLP
jgi:hypothetical protein